MRIKIIIILIILSFIAGYAIDKFNINQSHCDYMFSLNNQPVKNCTYENVSFIYCYGRDCNIYDWREE